MSSDEPQTPLTVAVVGATGVVGRTMIQVLDERGFPVGELRLLASGRSAGRTVSVDGRTLEVGEAIPEAFEGVDIALFSAGADVSQRAGAGRRRPRRHRHRQLVRLADGPERPARRHAGQPGRPRGPRGHHRQPQLLDDAARAVLMALRDAVGIERVIVDTYQSVSGTGAEALAELEGQIRAHVAGEPKRAAVYPTRSPSTRCPRSTSSSTTATPRRSGRSSPRAARSCTCRTCGSRARPSASRSSSATPRPSTSRRASPITPDRARELFAAVAGRRRPGRPGGARLPAGDARPPAATRSSWAASARTCRSPTTAASPSGSSRDNLRKGAATNAVEIAEVLVERDWVRRDRTRRPPVPGARERRRGASARDRRRAPRGARGDRRRGPRLHAVPPPRRPDQGRAGRGPSRHRGRLRRRGPGLQRGPPGPAVRRPRRRPARSSCSARSAGAARRSSSPTSSSAGRPATATRSRTRSRPARRTCSASSRCSTRRSS